MKCLFKISLDTSNSNIKISEGRIGRWIFSWENNKITAYALSNYQSANISEPLENVQNTKKLNLGLLIDILTLITNQDINTSIDISTDPIIDVYEINPSNGLKDLKEAKSLLVGSRKLTNASCLNPKQIDRSSTLTLNKDQLSIIEYLATSLQDSKLTTTSLKLANYWRQGVDLDRLGFMDSSYLAFYKIIEYFIKKSDIKNDLIEVIKFKLSKCIPFTRKLFAIESSNALRKARKFADGAGLRKVTNENLQLVSEFIQIRNNWDIAHMRINPLPTDKSSRLYYSHIENAWDYHSHICQITRFVILKSLGIKGIGLEENGGLLSLVIANNLNQNV